MLVPKVSGPGKNARALVGLFAGALLALGIASPALATPVVNIQPPPGSTPVVGSDGSVSYNLPPGAVAEKFNLSPTGAPAALSSTTATAVYPGDPSLSLLPHAGAASSPTTTASASAAAAPQCTVGAYNPTAPGGHVIEGEAEIGCNVPAAVSVIATLYWWSGSNWVWQSNNTNSGTSYANVFDFHGCTVGQTHQWHTRGDGTADYQGVLYSFPGVNSGSPSLKCR